MTNHLRTLLLNLPGEPRTPPDYPGEEYVPPDFRPAPLPPAVASARRLLFGGAPDRAMLNHRLRELLAFVHGTEMGEHALALDGRVSYWPPRPASLWPEGLTVLQYAGTSPSLAFVGEARAREQFGRLFSEWRVELVNGGDDVRVHYYDFASGTGKSADSPSTEPFDLPGSSLRAQVLGGPTGAWTVRGLAKPEQGPPELLSALEAGLSGPTLEGLFGTDPVEPYLTFRNLWFDHDQTAYRLGGVVLATGYRADEAWRGG